jgi:hypothetical protein
MRCRESVWSVGVTGSDKYATYLWGKSTVFLVLNLVVHRKTTKCVTVLGACTYIVQYLHTKGARGDAVG